jgi:hypothetical protein
MATSRSCQATRWLEADMSDSVVHEARAALAKYKSDGVMPTLPDDMQHNDFAVWHCCFEDHLDVWEMISLVENQRMALESWDRYCNVRDMESTDEVGRLSFLDVTAMLAQTMVQQYSRHNLDGGTFSSVAKKNKWIALFKKLQPQIVEIWLNAFHECREDFWEAFKKSNDRHGMFFPDSAAIINEALEKL